MMKERLLTRGLIGVSLLFAFGLFYLLVEIDRHRRLLEEPAFANHRTMMQATERATALAFAIQDISRSDTGAPSPWQSLASHIGPLRNSINRIVEDTQADRVNDDTTLLRVRELLDHVRSLMNLSVSASPARIEPLRSASLELVKTLNALSQNEYSEVARTRRLSAVRLDVLARVAHVMAMAMVLVSAGLALMLLRANRRVSSVSEEARSHEERLDKAIEELSSGDKERRAQNRFIAAASHDLRQPLHALGLYLTALRRHVSSTEGQAILASAHQSNEALNQLLNGLLDISRLDAGVVDVDEQAFELAGLFEQLQQTFQPDAEERGLLLDVQQTRLWIETDRVLLDRILRNLISNALNYTARGSVRVKACRRGESIAITVCDTGLGIPAAQQEAIFNEYCQLHNPERDRSKGLGLGLSIVRRLARLLDLTLSIDSIEGRGTTFEIRVPPAQSMPDEAPQSAQSAISSARADSLCVEGLTILVIDDEKDILDGMYSLLSSCGSRVIVADSASAATDRLIESEVVPDLIIVDFRLRGEQTGNDAIERVREEVNEDVPAMIITGDTSPDRLKEATASGCMLLHKPVGSEELFASIRQLIEV